MRRLILLLATLGAIACKLGDDPPPPVTCAVNGGLTLPFPKPGLYLPGDFVGSVVKGQSSTALSGTASAYEQGSTTAGFTVLSAFTTDAQNRPTGEFFLFLRSPINGKTVQLVPVTLDQLKDRNFVPSGPFAVYADSYDQSVGDYTRWLLGKSGCIAASRFNDNDFAHFDAFSIMTGLWETLDGTLLGEGSASVLLGGPLLNLRTSSDGMTANVVGVRAKYFTSSHIDAYQLLNPAQTRLVIVATQAADSTREIWLSVAGVPQPGDSIALGTLTLAEARAGRTSSNGSFGMMRVLELDNVGKPIVREIWRSTTGFVRFPRAVQNGPLALCGWVGGDFQMTMQGVSLANPAVDLGTSTAMNAPFLGRITILPQSDTLRDQATLPSLTRRLQLAAPISTSGLKCP